MKNPLYRIFNPLRNHYYFDEIVQLTSIASLVLLCWLAATFTDDLLAFAATPNGMIWILSFFSGLVLALTIRLFFNMIMIKYSDKAEQFALFNKTEAE
jgi:hypothetical protein